MARALLTEVVLITKKASSFPSRMLQEALVLDLQPSKEGMPFNILSENHVY
jgi:hypothetical protein